MAETNFYFPPGLTVPDDYDADAPTRATEMASIVLLRNFQQMSLNGHVIDDGRPTIDDESLMEQMATGIQTYASSVTSGLDLPVPLPPVSLPTGLDPASIAVWVAQLAIKYLINLLINQIQNGTSGEGNGWTDEEKGALIDAITSMSSSVEEIRYTQADVLEVFDDLAVTLKPEEGEELEGEEGIFALLQKALVHDSSEIPEDTRYGLAQWLKLAGRTPLTLRLNSQHGVDWSFESEEEAP